MSSPIQEFKGAKVSFEALSAVQIKERGTEGARYATSYVMIDWTDCYIYSYTLGATRYAGSWFRAN